MTSAHSNRQGASLIEQIKGLSRTASAHPSEDVVLATAVVLFEIALSNDHQVDKIERSIIESGLRRLFTITDEELSNVMLQARNHHNNYRGSSSELTVLKESLDPISRQEVVRLVDAVVNSSDKVQGFEGFVRNKVRHALGMPLIPVESSSS